jgi:MFS family permease
LSRRRAFGSIYISIAISYLGVGLVAPLISLVLYQHGANSFEVGLVGTTMFTVFTLSSFPIGALIDRIGSRPVLIGGLIVYGASILLFALIRVTWLFFIVRGIEGLGGAAISVATETMINQLSGPDERAQRMSYYGLAVGIGWALGPVVGTSLFGVYPWLPFVACYVFSNIAALLVAGFVPATVSRKHYHTGILSGLSKRILIPLSAGSLYGYLMSSTITLFPLYLEKRGLPEVLMGTIITSVIAGTIVSQVPIGRAADRLGKRRVLLLCSLVVTGLFMVFPLRIEWWYFVSLGALLGGAAGSLYPIGLAMIGELVEHQRLGAATALFSLAFGTGSLIGPTISGLAMSRLGDSWLFYLPAALTAAFALELLLLYRKAEA